MKTWKWTHTALGLMVVGLMTIGAGCEDPGAVKPAMGPAPTTTVPPEGSPTTLPPAQPEAGSAIGGGVDVPPPAKTDAAPAAADAAPAALETPAAAADAPKNPEEIKKDETDKPAEEKKE